VQSVVDERVAIETEPDRPEVAIPESKPFAPWRPQTFGLEDQDVTPPAPIEQQMPAWNVAGTAATVVFDGRLEVLIDENGLVTSAKIIKWSHPAYDSTLVSAARRWRYSPAVRDGQPVRYRKVIDFTLRGR
jgi:TonB family protein